MIREFKYCVLQCESRRENARFCFDQARLDGAKQHIATCATPQSRFGIRRLV